MKTTYLSHKKIQSGYQVNFWFIFSSEEIAINKEVSLLVEFVHSDIFKQTIRPEATSQTAAGNYPRLQSAFNLTELQQSNFRVVQKEELFFFFREYAQSDNWGDDRADFIVIMNKFLDLLVNESAGSFYLISKEWFERGDVVLSDDSEIFLYYFLVIWVSPEKEIINVCEWCYD